MKYTDKTRNSQNQFGLWNLDFGLRDLGEKQSKIKNPRYKMLVERLGEFQMSGIECRRPKCLEQFALPIGIAVEMIGRQFLPSVIKVIP